MKSVIIALILLVTVSCHQATEKLTSESPDAAPAQLGEPVSQPENDAGETDRPDRMMIRTGILAWEAEDPYTTRQNILRALQKAKGYVAEDNEERLYDRTRYTLVMRVPSDRFDELLMAVSKGVGAFETRDIQVIDVSAQYVDLSERLKTRKELENRYRQLLAKAEKVEDMLRIEKGR
ncbi:MAG: DUF4349 domain-containing protein [Cyclobacteriaceae bacterium]